MSLLDMNWLIVFKELLFIVRIIINKKIYCLGCPARFLFVSPAQIQLERTPFWDCQKRAAAVTNTLKEIPVQDFQASYDAWQNRWQRCIDAQGCYFEEY